MLVIGFIIAGFELNLALFCFFFRAADALACSCTSSTRSFTCSTLSPQLIITAESQAVKSSVMHVRARGPRIGGGEGQGRADLKLLRQVVVTHLHRQHARISSGPDDAPVHFKKYGDGLKSTCIPKTPSGWRSTAVSVSSIRRRGSRASLGANCAYV